MSQRDQILHMLQLAGDQGVTGNEFYKACLPRFAARIKELRDRGYEISTERVDTNHFVYTLRRSAISGGSGNSQSSSGVSLTDGPSNDLRTESALSLAGPGATAQMPCQGHGRTGGDHSSSSVPCLPGGGRSEVGEASVTAISRCLNPYEYEAEEAA